MKIPEQGSQLQLGDESVFVYAVDTSGDNPVSDGRHLIADERVVLTCHDDNGDEVEIRFFPESDDE